MTISIWRYSHLALAISSFVFIFLASVTGIILAFEPISEQIQPYKIDGFEKVTLAETVAVFQEKYPEVIDLEVDSNQFVLASVITAEGHNLNGYFNPITAAFLGAKMEPSKFFQFTTNFHRSLFLKSTGRFLVGLGSFLLLLIALSGTVLILIRQRSLKKFFAKIVNENFNQYWHVVLGRLSLIPIIIITITGVFLSLEKFDVFPTYKSKHQIDFDTLSETPKKAIQDFDVFKDIQLSQVKSVEFPFSRDVEDYFTIVLKNKELVVNQFTGTVLSEVKDPLIHSFSSLSLNLHTGKGSVIWSLILAIACINILFFIYSGFRMTLKRRASTLKNKFKKAACSYVILVGSENGSTLKFANALYYQLLKAGKKVYITEANKYTTFEKMEQLIVLTATYGQGDAPTNATQFLKLLKTIPQKQVFSFSVVGFGSLAYPDFCRFAFETDKALQEVQATQLLAPFTINDRSIDAFSQWVHVWSEKVGLKITIVKEDFTATPPRVKALSMVGKTNVKDNPDDTFLITLAPNHRQKFRSGDLLAVYPKNDYRERFYSIGKVAGKIQLSVKYYDNGLGSNFLNSFEKNDFLKGRIIKNSTFHFPKKAPRVILIANGTGIAPFLGMLSENKKLLESHLYVGLRTERSKQLYASQIDDLIEQQKLTTFKLALSKEDKKQYVQELLNADAAFIADTLKNNGVIMICGSLAMQEGVFRVLELISQSNNNKPLSYYQNKQQLKADCY
tara:strand:- start:103624 stop:105819 length:2196 start_codon:yes stop_codon:yes gene_type:complete